MDRIGLKLDWWMLVSCILLSVLGLLVIRSVAPEQLLFQSIFMVVCFTAMALFSFIDYRILVALNVPLYIASVLSLFLPFIFGASSRGAHRWLQFGEVSLQPSEIIKPLLLMTFAFIAASDLKHKFLWLLGAYLIPVGIIFVQPDLGTALVVTVGWLAIAAFTVPKKWVITIALGLLLLSPITWMFLRDYQKNRLLTFVDPYADPLGRGYHVIQSVIAVGSGEIFGRGLGHGTQSSLRFLPEHHTDFIFASLSEELGFLGGLGVILLFGLLLWRIERLTEDHSDIVARLYCLGVLAQLTFQIFVNVGMNMGVAPVTGITLPFLSYGGSSLLSLGIALGIVNSIYFRYNLASYASNR